MHARIEDHFRRIVPSGQFCSLRFVHERSEFLCVRQNVLQPVSTAEDMGAMVTVVADGGLGYAGTSDITLSGLQRASRARASLGAPERQAECGGFFEDGQRASAGGIR